MPSNDGVSNRRRAKSSVETLSAELAEAADLTPAQARRVLDIFHVDKLVENGRTTKRLLSDRKVIAALGLSESEAQERLSSASPDMMRLANLRIGIKPMGGSSIIV